MGMGWTGGMGCPRPNFSDIGGKVSIFVKGQIITVSQSGLQE